MRVFQVLHQQLPYIYLNLYWESSGPESGKLRGPNLGSFGARIWQKLRGPNLAESGVRMKLAWGAECVKLVCLGNLLWGTLPCEPCIEDLFGNPCLEKTLLWNRALGTLCWAPCALGTLSWEPSLYKSFEACLRNSDDAKNAIYIYLCYLADGRFRSMMCQHDV